MRSSLHPRGKVFFFGFALCLLCVPSRPQDWICGKAAWNNDAYNRDRPQTLVAERGLENRGLLSKNHGPVQVVSDP